MWKLLKDSRRSLRFIRDQLGSRRLIKDQGDSMSSKKLTILKRVL